MPKTVGTSLAISGVRIIAYRGEEFIYHCMTLNLFVFGNYSG